MKPAVTARWPAKAPGRVSFDIARIEAAIARTDTKVAYHDPDMPAVMQRHVSKMSILMRAKTFGLGPHEYHG